MPTAPNPNPTTKMAPEPKSLFTYEDDIEFVFLSALQVLEYQFQVNITECFILYPNGKRPCIAEVPCQPPAKPRRGSGKPVRGFSESGSGFMSEPKESKLHTMDPNSDIRWKERFQNFDRAFVLLRDAMENGPEALNPLEKEGVIQRFEYCFELAGKTIKDYLEESGFVFVMVTPRQVIKDAYAAKILADGQGWIADANLKMGDSTERKMEGAMSSHDRLGGVCFGRIRK